MCRGAAPKAAVGLLAAILGCGPCSSQDGEAETTATAVGRVCPESAPAPSPLPGVRAEHLTVEYWIERSRAQGDPDQAIMSAGDVEQHNHSLARLVDGWPLGRDDLTGPVDRAAIAADASSRLDGLRAAVESGRLVAEDGRPLSRREVGPFRVRPDPDRVRPELTTALEPVPMRCGPRTAGLYDVPPDLRIDRNACSTARAGETLQILAPWPGGMRLARTDYVLGWIGPNASLSPPLSAAQAEALTHERRAARPMTRRAVLEAAFALLESPYGWGDTGAGRDCSRFVMDVFESFGLLLPRNSARQAQAGTFSVTLSDQSDAERAEIIEAAGHRGVVLLHFPGHIMLYLGLTAEGVPMAIHAFADYLEPCANGGETRRTVERIAVSDLELGRGTSRRSFLDRITRVTVLGRGP